MTAAYQPNAYQPNAYQTSGGIAIPAFQANAFQFGAFQEDELTAIPAFQPCVFQFDAFQTDVCPIPPEPILNDGHDGGRKRAQKKLKELEDKRIALVREDAERRKMLIRHAIDPQAKAEYEARMAAKDAKITKDINKELAKIDKQIENVQNLKKNIALQGVIKVELQNMMVARQIRAAEIQRQIQEADDELALMMMM